MTSSTVVGKYRTLSEYLYRRTIDGSISWSLVNESCVFVSVGEYGIYLSEEHGDIPDVPDVLVRIIGKNGDTVESFRDLDISGVDVVPSLPGFTGYFALLLELFTLAKRQISGSDVVLDEVISLLEG